MFKGDNNEKKKFIKCIFLVLLCILLTNTFKIEVFAQSTPKIGIVSLDHVAFVQGNNNEFYISAKDYTGQVQYQLFYIQESVMKEWRLINNQDMVNGWTNPMDAQAPTIVDISSLSLKTDKYRFAIRVRRVGVKGLHENKYGDYDDAYPFNLDVVKNTTVELSGNMNIEKTNFSKSENLVINGVGSLTKDIQYKLHLFDVKNNKWLTDLTGYNTSVNYSLKNIPEGTYIVDLWAKNINSKNKYDGWKLKTITVQNSLAENIVVNFPDSNLNKVIRDTIDKPYGDIYKSDVEKIESIEYFIYPADDEVVPDKFIIFDLSGMENLTNLEVLNLAGNSISDVSPLKGLTNLGELSLWQNNISNISPLKGLTNLNRLDLSHNQISELSALKGLINLKDVLDLSDNQINDLSPLAGLTNLYSLDLSNNQISIISSLNGMSELLWLKLNNNQISDTSALAGLTNLTDLRLGNNSIRDISNLSGLINLETLLLENNTISDTSALRKLNNLKSVSFASNGLRDISVLKELTNLTKVYSDKNEISDISPLAGLTNLTLISFEYNNISDISALKGLINLTEPYLNNNMISDADMKVLKNALPEGVEF